MEENPWAARSSDSGIPKGLLMLDLWIAVRLSWPADRSLTLAALMSSSSHPAVTPHPSAE
ncbi:MAG: hypothetical protein AB7U20_17515 [Planctomycetaceae bacterium]